MGTPAWRAAQETKYAHHGPTPLPAVAWRYCPMRGESLEPGGCSAWPTSPRTRLTIAWPADVGAESEAGTAEATPLDARLAVPPAAAEVPRPEPTCCSAVANDVPVVGVAVGAGFGASTDWSSAIRLIVASIDIAPGDRPPRGDL